MKPAVSLFVCLQAALLATDAAAHERPKRLPTVRTFMNFGGDAAWMRERIDLCFRHDVRQDGAGPLAIRYELVCTMIEPSPTAEALRAWCRQEGLDYEDCFIHFAADTRVTLHVGAESAANPRETRVCPGWDPRHDADGDGRVSDAEFAVRVNPAASARRRREARVPIYYWGPPADDFVMHVGLAGYQRFIAERHVAGMAAGWDGIFFDTVPDDVAGPGRSASVVEYPRKGLEADRWSRDLQALFARVRAAQPGKLLIANGWSAEPLVIDGFEAENWLALAVPAHEWLRRIERARAHDRLGHVQLLQFNPVHDARLVPFGEKLPGVDRSRDRLYGLASYLMAHGGGTYFGYGLHPYSHVTELWFDAIGVDLGEPRGECRVWEAEHRATAPREPDLLRDGALDSLAGWRTAEGIEIDSAVKHEGAASVRLTSDDPRAIRIHSQPVVLEPRTAYTLSAWIKTQSVRGGIGAQVYPYEFTGATMSPVAMLTVAGTTDWARHEMTFVTADDAAGRISLRISEALGTAWIDDVRLTKGAAPPVPRIFVREFVKGLVFVRPPDGVDAEEVATVRLPTDARLRPLRADGGLDPPVSALGLRAGEAAIVVVP